MTARTVFDRDVFIDLWVKRTVRGVDDSGSPTGSVLFVEEVANVTGDF